MGHATESRLKIGMMLQDEKSEKDKSIIRQYPPTTPGDALTGQGGLGLREPPKSGTDALTRKKPMRPETWVRAYGNRAQKHGTRRQELFCSCNEIVCNCNDKSKKL